MKERPIIFSGDMVKAILEGRKTQTRRVVKNILTYSKFQKGMNLWVRESFAILREVGTKENFTFHKATTYGKDCERIKWKPSIYMPRYASRLTLEIVNVRIERVQDISEDDARAEGIFYHDGLGVGHNGWRRSHTSGGNMGFGRCGITRARLYGSGRVILPLSSPDNLLRPFSS